MTKYELVNSLIAARVDAEEEVPPSSPSGRTDYSSDDGHYGGGEETDVNKGSNKAYLRRRATVQDLGRPAKRTAVNRTLSMGVPDTSRTVNTGKKLARISTDVKSPTHQGYGMGQLKYVTSIYLFRHLLTQKTGVDLQQLSHLPVVQ